MKARVLLMAVLAAVLLVAGGMIAAPAAAGDAVVPFKASYVTYPEAEVEWPYLKVAIPAAGHATHLGKSTWYADMWVLLTEEPNPQWSDNMTFTAANGDKLFGSYEGYGTPIPDPEFWGRFEISGGTGRFEGVTGSGAYWGQVSGETGMLHFVGTLTK